MNRLRLGIALLGVVIIAACLCRLAFSTGSLSAQGLPPGPIVYSGTATVAGTPVPDGHTIFARVGEYQSKAVTVSDGKYDFLSVSPGDASLAGQTITFYLDGLQGDQTAIYIPAGFPTLNLNFLLTFSAVPMPTPTPTAEPTETPIPSPTPGPPEMQTITLTTDGQTTIITGPAGLDADNLVLNILYMLTVMLSAIIR